MKTISWRWSGDGDSAAEDLAKDLGQIVQRFSPVAHIDRAMHRREGVRIQRSQPAECGIRQRAIGHVIRQRTLLIFLEHVATAPDDIGLGNRFTIASLVEEIGTEQRSLGLFAIPAASRIRRPRND